MKKKIIAIVAGLLAVAAVAVWAFWPVKPPEKMAPMGFPQLVKPLCQGEMERYEILDKKGQDITEQVMQAIQKDVEAENWNGAAKTAFSMAKSICYEMDSYQEEDMLVQRVMLGSVIPYRDDPNETYWVVCEASASLHVNEDGTLDESSTDHKISNVGVSPNGEYKEGGLQAVEIAPDGKSASASFSVQVGQKGSGVEWRNLSKKEAVAFRIRPLAQ